MTGGEFDGIVIAVLALIGVVLTSLVAAGTTLAVQLVRWKQDNRLLWRYNRDLIDHIYRGNPPPPPPPPSELFD